MLQTTCRSGRPRSVSLLLLEHGADNTFWSQKVLAAELGPEWRSRFEDFSDVPMAAASIGQVHAARLAASQDSGSPQEVAVKVQFPGVFQSITSDLSYLKVLVSSSAVLPKGLFLENTMKVLGQELREECDYGREAWCGMAMGRMLEDDENFRVPKVYEGLSTGMVLTAEFMKGTPLTKAAKWPQKLRDQVSCLLATTGYQLIGRDADRLRHLEALSARDLAFPADADRPELDQLSLELGDSAGACRMVSTRPRMTLTSSRP